MRRIYLIGSVALGLLGFNQVAKSQVVTQTLNYTGSVQTLTVPACVSQISFTAYGAQGANGASTASAAVGGTGGLGAMVIGTYTVGGGGVLNVYVGGAGTGSVGGFNGGGNGGTNTLSAGAGGGASDVRIGGTALANRIIVAGGGGGGGHAGCASSTISGGNGGAGGGGNGTAGVNSQAGGGGAAGTGTTGGAAGIGCSLASGTVGANGTLGIGGNGGNGPAICGAFVSGGGGGGGFNGGGGGGGGTAGTTSCTLNDQGGGGGGAGGTNFFSSAFTSTSATNGVRTGNGLVIISYSVGVSPTVTATSPTMCVGNTVTLTASGATSYTWSNGPTTNTNAVNPTTSTSYTVIGTGIAPGCTAQAVVNVTVNPTPTVGAVASSASVCSGNTVILTGTGANTYTWTAPNAPVPSNGVAFSPSTTSTPSGNVVYTVTGTSALGCTSTATSTIGVVITPSVAPTTSTAQICVGGGTITVTASGANSYSWTPGNFTTNVIAVAPSTTTTYTLVRANGACSFTSNITLTVNPNPGLIIVSNQSSVCSTNQATLTAGGASTYTWSTAAIPSFTGSPVVVTPTAIGSPSNITYTVLGNNGTCTTVTTYTLPVFPNPTISIATATAALCLNQSVTLTANSNTASPATSYSWSTAAPAASYTTQSVVLTPTATGAHTAIITNTYGCTSSSVQVIVVYPLPAVTASVVNNKNLVCSGGTTTVSAGGANSYTWTGGPSTATSLVSPLVTTIYTVTGKTTTTGCTNTKTVQVNVFIPVISITGPSATCYGGQISLNGNGGTTYTWNPGGSIFPSINLTPTTSIVVFLTGQTSSLGVSCARTTSTQITIYPNPTISAMASPSAICRGEVAALSSTGASTYLWSDNQTGSPVNVSPTAQSVYTVIGTDGNGCKDTVTVLVKVSPCVGINEMTNNNKVIGIAPNPNTGEFTIDSDADAVLTLVNALGQTVRTIKVINSANNRVSVTDLPGGIYYIVGEKDGLKINQKIVIQK